MGHPRRTHRCLPIVPCALLIGISVSAALAAPHKLVIEDLVTVGGDGTVATALNDRGQVVGVTIAASDGIRPFLWESGQMTDLGPENQAPVDINNHGQILFQDFRPEPDSPSSCFLRDGDTTVDLGHLGGIGTECFASDLNNRGQVVGAIAAPNVTTVHAFLWQSGTMIDLGSLGGDWTIATQINDRGQIVGMSTRFFGDSEHAFLWDAGVMTDLGTPGADWSRAVAINNHGQVVLQSGNHVYLWEAGSTTDLGNLGGVMAQPLDINDRGQILACVSDGFPSPIHCVIWDAGTLIPLPGVAGNTAGASRLNNRGQAAGYYFTISGISHAALWTPSTSPK